MPAPAPSPTQPERFGAALRATRAWSVVREAFAKRQLKIGGGWEDFITRLSSTDEKHKDLQAQVELVYRDLMLLGKRAVQAFTDRAFPWAEAKAALNALTVSSSAFSSAYPLPLSEAALKALPILEPVLVEVRELGNDIALIFSSHQTYIERDEVKPHELGATAPPSLARYQRLIGESTISFQTFDAIVLRPSDHRVEFWIDDPHGMDEGDIGDMVAALFQYLEQVVPATTTIMGSGVNLFPAIREIYEDPIQGGSVAKLWFATSGGNDEEGAKGGSRNRGIMQRKGEDLRTDKFHAAGVAEIGKNNIKPYAIEVDFSILDSVVVVRLMGTRKDLMAAAGGTLYVAHIEGCVSVDQLRRTGSKLATFIS